MGLKRCAVACDFDDKLFQLRIASSTAVHVCYANRVLFVDFFCCDVPDFLAVPGTYM